MSLKHMWLFFWQASSHWHTICVSWFSRSCNCCGAFLTSSHEKEPVGRFFSIFGEKKLNFESERKIALFTSFLKFHACEKLLNKVDHVVNLFWILVPRFWGLWAIFFSLQSVVATSRPLDPVSLKVGKLKINFLPVYWITDNRFCLFHYNFCILRIIL